MLILIFILKVHTESFTLTWQACCALVNFSFLTEVIYLEVRDVCLALLLVFFQCSDEERVHRVVSVTFRLVKPLWWFLALSSWKICTDPEKPEPGARFLPHPVPLTFSAIHCYWSLSSSLSSLFILWLICDCTQHTETQCQYNDFTVTWDEPAFFSLN